MYARITRRDTRRRIEKPDRPILDQSPIPPKRGNGSLRARGVSQNYGRRTFTTDSQCSIKLPAITLNYLLASRYRSVEHLDGRCRKRAAAHTLYPQWGTRNKLCLQPGWQASRHNLVGPRPDGAHRRVAATRNRLPREIAAHANLDPRRMPSICTWTSAHRERWTLIVAAQDGCSAPFSRCTHIRPRV